MEQETVIIIGCARSGIGAAKLAHAKGYQVTLYDQKALECFDTSMQLQIKALQAQGIVFKQQPNISLEAYDYVVMSPGVPMTLEFVQEAIARGQKVIGEIEFAYTYCQAPVIGITGTNGKTTTTALVGEIMKAFCKDTYVVGNIGRAFSEDVLCVPESGYVVAEVSSFQLEAIETFQPHVAAILNITPDHLNRHKTMANYCEAKYNITKYQQPSDYLVLNVNDPYYREACEQTIAKVLSFDSSKEVAFGAYCLDNTLYENISGVTQSLCNVDELKILGKHNIENALAAIAIAKAMGVPNAVIRETLLGYAGFEHRIEFVATCDGVDYYNDSKATNVDAATQGVLAMKKPIHLIAGGLDKQVSFDAWTNLFQGRVKKVYLIGETKEQLVQACLKSGFDAFACFDTLQDAVRQASQEALPGECVLLSPACASWDMFKSFEERGDLFKEIVNHLEG